MRLLTVLLCASLPLAAIAADPVPHAFEAGDVVSAEQMNDNFDALTDAITDLEALVATLDAALSTSEGDVSALQSEVSSLTTALATVESQVDGAVPSGTLAFFDLASCPTGWSEATSAGGRLLVALPSGGALGGTVGAPLSNQEAREHTHSTDIGSLSFTTSSAGSHNHQWAGNGATYASTGAPVPLPPALLSSGSTWTMPHFRLSGSYYTNNDGDHSHSGSVNPPRTTSSATDSGMPYIQYRLCERD